MNIVKMKIDDLKPAPYNPRLDLKPGDKEYEKIKRSLEEFGYVEPIIYNKTTGYIIGGHQRAKVLKDLGHTEIEVNVVEMSEMQEKALNVALNKIGGDWDFYKLKDLLEDIDTGAYDVTLTGFDEKEIEKLMTQYKLDPELEEDDFNEDVALEAIEKPFVKPGDIWDLGRHRLMCGDSTKVEQVLQLMNGAKAHMVFTDPPYGVSYKGTNFEVIANDNLRESELLAFLTDAFKSMAEATIENPAIYVCYASKTHREFEDALNTAGFKVKSQIIWAKQMVLGRGDYHWAHEPILYAIKDEKNCKYYGNRCQKTVWDLRKEDIQNMKKEELVEYLLQLHEQTSVWDINREFAGGYVHPTQKPVALPGKAISNSSQTGDVVLELFGGSGSTLMAAEQLNRKCYAMEFDTKYAQVIVKRYIEYVESSKDVYVIRKGKRFHISEIGE